MVIYFLVRKSLELTYIVFTGSSPKEFLFLMAFALPCCAIVLCYARIFYIVRKTAFKLQDNQVIIDDSVRIPNDHPITNIKRNQRNGKSLKHLASTGNDDLKDSPSPSTETNISLDGHNKKYKKKFLSKTKEDDLKFIDTSVESDLPPTLSQLQRKSVKLLIDEDFAASNNNDNSTYIQLEIEQLSTVVQDSVNQRDDKKMDAPNDSAVGESVTNSLKRVCLRI